MNVKRTGKYKAVKCSMSALIRNTSLQFCRSFSNSSN